MKTAHFTTTLALLTATIMMALSPAGAQTESSPSKHFDIGLTSLSNALSEFAKQSDRQIFFESEIVDDKQTSGFKGDSPPEAVLEVLLKGTGLTFRVTSDATILIENARQNEVAGTRESENSEITMVQSETSHNLSQPTQNNHPSPPRATEEAGGDTLAEPEEVIVTGTHIRGVESVTPVMSFSAVDIANTGFATIQDWSETLPQNYGTNMEENGATGNYNRGVGINLRGLGAGATLILVNGRRQPLSGLEGDFIDISSLPSSAIERVDVLTDGASAIYGSDAIGGVVNFVLREDFAGAQSSARYSTAGGEADEKLFSQLLGTSWNTGHVMVDYQYYQRDPLRYGDRAFTASADKRRYGGSDLRSFNSNPGNIIVDGLPAYAIPSNQSGIGLSADDLIPGQANRAEPLRGATSLPDREMHSIFISATQQIAPGLELFLDGRYNQRKIKYDLPAFSSQLFVTAGNPFFVSPDGLPFVLVGYDFFDDFGVSKGQGDTKTLTGAVGATYDFGPAWSATLSLTHGQEELDFELDTVDIGAVFGALFNPDPAQAFNPFGDGSNTNPAVLDTLRMLQVEHGESKLQGANLILDGPLFSMSGGEVKFAFGGDYRTEDLNRGIVTPTEYDRTVKAAFAEVVLPIFSGANAQPGLQQLQLSAAARHEEYSDFGSTFNPKISLQYKPIGQLTLRGSWGTSFRAPLLVDLDEVSLPANYATANFYPDPQSDFGFSEVLERSGGNSHLKEETAEIWNVGIDFKPSENLAVSLTYLDIKYDDRILTPGPLQPTAILTEEDLWSSVITRNPARAQIDEVCMDPTFVGLIESCLLSEPAAIIDLRKRNLASTRQRALDLTVDQVFATEVGTFGIRLNGTYLLNYEIAVTPQSKLVDLVNTLDSPTDLRVRTTGFWDHRGWVASLSWNHTSGFKESLSSSRSVDAWDTFDLRVAYSTSDVHGWFGGVELALSASNVLDEEPPFVNNLFGYDAYSASPLGRVMAFQVTKSW